MIDIIEKTIHSGYRLDRQGRDWMLAGGLRLRAPSRRSFAFSLDKEGKRPFSFFSGSPPVHIAKMCDAIIAFFYREKLYLLMVEQKTGNPDQYEDQLINGKLFCDWLFSLYRRYGYCSGEPVYIGLLAWQPWPTSRKGKTGLRSTAAGKHELFAGLFEKRNERRIHLGQLADSLPEA